MAEGVGEDARRARGSKLATVSGNALAQLFGQGIQNLISAAILILITRSLSPDLYGRYGFVLALSTALALLANGGFTYIVARDVAVSPPSEQGPILGAALVLRAAASVVVLVGLWAVGRVAGASAETLGLVSLSFAALSLWLLAEAYGGMLAGIERLSHWSLASTLARAANLAMVVGALRWKMGLAGLFGATLAANLMMLAALAVFAHRRFVRASAAGLRDRAATLLRQSAPVGLSMMAQYGSWQTPILLLRAAGSWRAVGVFYGPVRLVEMFRILPAAIGGALMARLSAGREPEEQRRTIRLLVGGILAVTVPLSVGIAVYAEPIIRLAFGSAYAESTRPLRLLAVLVSFVGLNGALDFVLVAGFRQKDRMVASLAGFVGGLAVFMGVWPRDPILAACSSLLAAEGIGCALCLRALIRRNRRSGWPGILLKPVLAGAAVAAPHATSLGHSHPIGAMTLGLLAYGVALAALGVIPLPVRAPRDRLRNARPGAGREDQFRS